MRSKLDGYKVLTVGVLVGVIVALFALSAQGTGTECEKFRNHSGHVPAGWTATFIEDGESYGPYQGPTYVDPETAKDGNRTWDKAIKCKTPPETTTTTTVGTTTTLEPSTTTAPSSTTTTTQPTTSSTNSTSTSSTTTIPAPTTTAPTESTTTSPQPTTSQPTTPSESVEPPDELPATGLNALAVPFAFALLGAGVGTLGYARRKWGSGA